MSEFDHRPPQPSTGAGYFEAQADPPRAEPRLPLEGPEQTAAPNFAAEIEGVQRLQGVDLLKKATDLALHFLVIQQPSIAEHILRIARDAFELENRRRTRQSLVRRNRLLKEIWSVAAGGLLIMSAAAVTLFHSAWILLPIGLVCVSAGLVGTLLVHFDFLDVDKLQHRDKIPELPETIFR